MREKFLFILLFLESSSIFVANVVSFFITIYLFNETKSASVMALAMFFSIAPKIYVSFIAGRYVDYYGRIRLLKITSFLFFSCYFIMYFLSSFSYINVPIILCFLFISSIISSFHEISLISSISVFVAKIFYHRVYSILNFSTNSIYVLAPLTAAWIMNFLILEQILLFSWIPPAIFCLYMLTTGVSDKPLLKRTLERKKSHKSFIMSNELLRTLLFFFAGFNFANGLTSGFVVAYILTLFSGNQFILGQFNAALAFSTVLGSFAAFKRYDQVNPIIVIILCALVASFCGRILFSCTTTIYLLTLLASIRAFVIPIMNNLNQVAWASETPPAIQGGVFGYRKFIAQGGYPIAILLSILLPLLFETDKESFYQLAFFFSGLLEFAVILATLITTIKRPIMSGERKQIFYRNNSYTRKDKGYKTVN